MRYLKEDETKELFRGLMLEALDQAAKQIFPEGINKNDAGATDADLTSLFNFLDSHLETLASRFNCKLYSEDEAPITGIKVCIPSGENILTKETP